MFCKSSCLISIIFLLSMIYMQISMPYVDKKKFFEILDEKQKEKYTLIKNFRLKLYFVGYLIGLILAISFIIINLFNNYTKLNPLLMTCFVTSFMFIFQYFYYIIHPKPDYMVLHLKTKEQKKAWLKIYRSMQLNYHIGFVIGIVAISLFTISFR